MNETASLAKIVLASLPPSLAVDDISSDWTDIPALHRDHERGGRRGDLPNTEAFSKQDLEKGLGRLATGVSGGTSRRVGGHHQQGLSRI